MLFALLHIPCSFEKIQIKCEDNSICTFRDCNCQTLKPGTILCRPAYMPRWSKAPKCVCVARNFLDSLIGVTHFGVIVKSDSASHTWNHPHYPFLCVHRTCQFDLCFEAPPSMTSLHFFIDKAVPQSQIIDTRNRLYTCRLRPWAQKFLHWMSLRGCCGGGGAVAASSAQILPCLEGCEQKQVEEQQIIDKHLQRLIQSLIKTDGRPTYAQHSPYRWAKYQLFRNNCEHFVFDVVYGQHFSWQCLFLFFLFLGVVVLVVKIFFC